MEFPEYVSFTITNKCNLRCKMCGQWSEEGYMHAKKERLRQEMALEDWKRLVDEFQAQYDRYVANLEDLENYPYVVLSDAEYRTWFEDAATPVGSLKCMNVEKLIDIQPNGEVNFCVDFPDYTIGNVLEGTIEGIWNGERAQRFRNYRREKPLAVCYRCGAKYISEIDV